MKPKYIILCRHGESEGNVDRGIYSTKPDYALDLTPKGIEQAQNLGKFLRTSYPGKYAIYYSPFFRTIQTLNHIIKGNKDRILIDKKWIREDPRLREQEWTGGLRKEGYDETVEDEREAFGHFLYRFKDGGESCADVYDRISDFLNTLHRDFEKIDFPDILLIPNHGMTMRVFVMRFFHKTIEEFEKYANPKNCEPWILKLNEITGKYTLISSIRLHEVKHQYRCKLEI